MAAEPHTVLGRTTRHPATAAEHEEQLAGGLAPVTCDHCGAQVRVKKNSPAHTSIQWTSAAVRTCARLASQVAQLGTSAFVGGCEPLQASIDRAVREGRLAPSGYGSGSDEGSGPGEGVNGAAGDPARDPSTDPAGEVPDGQRGRP